MKLTCTVNYCDASPLVLPRNPFKDLSDSNFVSSSEWYTIDSVYSGYCLQVGIVYTVYSVMIYKNEVRYLLIDDNGQIGFFPSKLFSNCDRLVFQDWELFDYSIRGDLLLLLGPSHIIGEYKFVCDIVEESEEMILALQEYRDDLDMWA